MKKIILACSLIVWVVSCINNSPQDCEPYLVGRPPQNAYTGLVKISDSDIRHYGQDSYMLSQDGGLSWQTVPVEDGNLYGKQSPVSGEFCRVFSGGNDEVYVVRSIGGINGESSGGPGAGRKCRYSNFAEACSALAAFNFWGSVVLV